VEFPERILLSSRNEWWVNCYTLLYLKKPKMRNINSADVLRALSFIMLFISVCLTIKLVREK